MLSAGMTILNWGGFPGITHGIFGGPRWFRSPLPFWFLREAVAPARAPHQSAPRCSRELLVRGLLEADSLRRCSFCRSATAVVRGSLVDPALVPHQGRRQWLGSIGLTRPCKVHQSAAIGRGS